ncbi:MAG: calcium-binding protein [Pseudomonadota bacterium]
MATIINSKVTDTQTDTVLRIKKYGSISPPGELTSAIVIERPSTDISIFSAGRIDGYDAISVEKLTGSFEIRNQGTIYAKDYFQSFGEPGSEYYESYSRPSEAVEISLNGGSKYSGLLRNDGSIISSDGYYDMDEVEGVAVSILGGEITILNNGTISGEVVLSGPGRDRLFTTEGSRIRGDVELEDAPSLVKHAGIADRILTSDKSDTLVVKSTGEIEYSASTRDGNDQVFNRGSIGSLDLGDGDDFYKAAGRGSARSIEGGDGNDTLRGANAADTLQGEDGDDIIIGGRGDDLLIAGAGADRLLFQPGDGNDTVEGFSTDEGDTLFLKAHGFESLADLHAQISIIDRNTVIDLGDDSILLVGFRQELEAEDVVL